MKSLPDMHRGSRGGFGGPIDIHGSLGTGEGGIMWLDCDGCRDSPPIPRPTPGARLGRLAVRLMAVQESISSSLEEVEGSSVLFAVAVT
jgi:hypothetical protein